METSVRYTMHVKHSMLHMMYAQTCDTWKNPCAMKNERIRICTRVRVFCTNIWGYVDCSASCSLIVRILRTCVHWGISEQIKMHIMRDRRSIRLSTHETQHATSLYYVTTNPSTPYTSLFSVYVALSVVLHTIAYSAGLYGISWLVGYEYPLDRLAYTALTLMIIMPLGYIGRLMRAKQLACIYEPDEVRSMMNTAYMCWYFLG